MVTLMDLKIGTIMATLVLALFILAYILVCCTLFLCEFAGMGLQNLISCFFPPSIVTEKQIRKREKRAAKRKVGRSLQISPNIARRRNKKK